MRGTEKVSLFSYADISGGITKDTITNSSDCSIKNETTNVTSKCNVTLKIVPLIDKWIG